MSVGSQVTMPGNKETSKLAKCRERDTKFADRRLDLSRDLDEMPAQRVTLCGATNGFSAGASSSETTRRPVAAAISIAYGGILVHSSTTVRKSGPRTQRSGGFNHIGTCLREIHFRPILQDGRRKLALGFHALDQHIAQSIHGHTGGEQMLVAEVCGIDGQHTDPAFPREQFRQQQQRGGPDRYRNCRLQFVLQQHKKAATGRDRLRAAPGEFSRCPFESRKLNTLAQSGGRGDDAPRYRTGNSEAPCRHAKCVRVADVAGQARKPGVEHQDAQQR